MARIIQSKFPIDLQPSRAVGFGFPLNGDAVFVPTYFTRDQIKANMVNYLLTNKGERVFRPQFGADLRNLLFENILDSTTEDLKSTIQSDINIFFPNVEVKEIKFNNQPDENTVNFTLIYQIVNFGIEDSINILLQ
jgi:phage baseplate assembly protein W|tara:strand:- start:2055 stop:2462 length:408 start_codon:yes stop_codon:yes gene_type:complete